MNQPNIIFAIIPFIVSFAMMPIGFILIQNAVRRNVVDLKESLPAYGLCVVLETIVYGLFGCVNFGLDITTKGVEITIANPLIFYQGLFALWLLMWLSLYVFISLIEYFQIRKIYSLYLMTDASTFVSDDDLKDIYKDLDQQNTYPGSTFNKSHLPPHPTSSVSSEPPNAYMSHYYVQPTAPTYQQATENGYIIDSLYPVVDVELCAPQSKV
jgi:hypothetical protein